MSLLTLEDVVVRIGDARLLDGVDLTVDAGRITALVGANGAGKTTLLDVVSGTMPSTSGRVELGGKPITFANGRPAPGVARVFQGSPMPDTLTVAEVVLLVAKTQSKAGEVMARFGLTEHAGSFVAELSTGMRRVLDLALTTIDRPALLLLDEPGAGLAPSEVEHLAELVLRWRDDTGGAVLVVEHDPTFLRRIADDVVVLDSGRVVANGAPDEMLDRRGTARPRMASPTDDTFRSTLGRVTSGAVPAAPLLRRSVSTWTLLRLGLREFAGGLISVLILGVLNRVMKVELGINLAIIAAILASYNLAAPIALAVGHRSDTKPIFGKRRIPYILGGTALSSLALVLAPHLAGRLAEGITLPVVLLGVLLFVLLGVGTYSSGAVFLALLGDVVPERERGNAISIVYFELVLGVIAGVILSGSLLDGEAGGLGTLFAVAAAVVFALTTFGVWGMEPDVSADDAIVQQEHVPVLTAVRRIAAMPRARQFFVFMTLATVFLFLQQAVLEPFGGEVLGLDVRTTNAFNAVQMVGVLVAMVLGGRGIADRMGHKKVAGIGLWVASASFGLLTFAALTESAPPSWFAILGLGLGMGLFSVAGLALMVNMADHRHAALFMGFWTLARAIADGISTAGGGAIFEGAGLLAGGDGGAYAAVFAVEALGLIVCVALLRRIEVGSFQREAEGVVTGAPARRELVAAGALD